MFKIYDTAWYCITNKLNKIAIFMYYDKWEK